MKDSISDEQQDYSDSDRMKVVRQEGELIRHTLILFQDFQNKKREKLEKRIKETRDNLPVTPYANTIVQTLKQNRVLLIAGDTGCGKSTQGNLSSRKVYILI